MKRAECDFFRNLASNLRVLKRGSIFVFRIGTCNFRVKTGGSFIPCETSKSPKSQRNDVLEHQIRDRCVSYHRRSVERKHSSFAAIPFMRQFFGIRLKRLLETFGTCSTASSVLFEASGKILDVLVEMHLPFGDERAPTASALANGVLFLISPSKTVRCTTCSNRDHATTSQPAPVFARKHKRTDVL